MNLFDLASVSSRDLSTGGILSPNGNLSSDMCYKLFAKGHDTLLCYRECHDDAKTYKWSPIFFTLGSNFLLWNALLERV